MGTKGLGYEKSVIPDTKRLHIEIDECNHDKQTCRRCCLLHTFVLTCWCNSAVISQGSGTVFVMCVVDIIVYSQSFRDTV